MKHLSIFLLLILCLATVFAAGFAAPQKPVTPPQVLPAQDTSPVTVDSARPVTEIIGQNNAYLATVSPDGKYIAWGQQSGKRQDRILHR